jgi:hypothetical protein
MTLNWSDDIDNCTVTGRGGEQVSDVDSLFLVYQTLSRMEDGDTINVAMRLEGREVGLSITHHGQMRPAPKEAA